MTYVKLIGVAALALAAVVVQPAAAFASVVTSPAGTVSTIKFHSVSNAHALLHGPSGSGITLECRITNERDIGSHGVGFSIFGTKTQTTITPCTNGWSVNILANGTWEGKATGGGNGVLYSTGTEMTIVSLSLHCVYKTSNTSMGTLTGGSPAEIDISASIPRIGGSSGIFCGTTGLLTDTMKVTSPSSLYIS